jgi:DNA-binding transcriptional LysR family regulator
MTTKQIDYILELSQTLNFNRAAENMFISQPTLTYQIKLAEEEIGFNIFDRTGKSVSLTPAGQQFCTTLRSIKNQLKNAIEQGQNFSIKYKEDISIGLPMRSAIYFLPKAITEFLKMHPSVSVSPKFIPLNNIDAFLRGEQDIVFALAEDIRYIPNIKVHKLFESGIYLITETGDVLAKKDIITTKDLIGRTLMVGGGSPPTLQIVQQRVLSEVKLDYFNSPDHETTLTNVATHRGICLAPGFLNDHNNEFAWTPFDCNETISCVLCTHNNDTRQSVKDFVKILQGLYKNNTEIPV